MVFVWTLVFNFFLFFPTDSFALSWESVEKKALLQSSHLEAHELEARALEFEAGQAARWKNPDLMTQVGSFKSGASSGATYEASITQAVPLSSKFNLRKKMKLLWRTHQKKQIDLLKFTIIHQAKISVWKLFSKYKLHQYFIQRKKDLEIISKYLRSRPKMTPVQKVEASMIKSRLIQIDGFLSYKKMELTKAQDEVEFWLGERVSALELDLLIPNYKNLVSSLDVNPLDSLNFKLASTKVKNAELSVDLAREEKIPDLFLGGGHRVESVSPTNLFSYAIVGVSIPIWDLGNDRVGAANARLRKEKKYLEAARKEILLQIKERKNDFTFALSQLKIFAPKTLSEHQNVIRQAQDGFKKGILNVNSFLEVEARSFELIEKIHTSWIFYLETLSSLQLIQGETLKWEAK